VFQGITRIKCDFFFWKTVVLSLKWKSKYLWYFVSITEWQVVILAFLEVWPSAWLMVSPSGCSGLQFWAKPHQTFASKAISERAQVNTAQVNSLP
jgi:hypothetical protein